VRPEDESIDDEVRDLVRDLGGKIASQSFGFDKVSILSVSISAEKLLDTFLFRPTIISSKIYSQKFIQQIRKNLYVLIHVQYLVSG
jgi:hypothetical protein